MLPGMQLDDLEKTRQQFLRYAEACAEQADSTSHDKVRDHCLKAEVTWRREMAARPGFERASPDAVDRLQEGSLGAPLPASCRDQPPLAGR